MGCYPPLGKMLSKALWICNGKKRYESSRTMVYSPPHSYSYARSMARNVAFSTGNPVIIATPSQPSDHHHHHHPSDVIAPSPHAEVLQPKEHPIHPDPAPEPLDQHGPAPHPNWTDRPRVRFSTGDQADQHGPRPNRTDRPHSRFAPEPVDPHEGIPHPGRKEQAHVRFAGGPIPGPNIHEPVSGYHHADPGFRYMASPLPRSEYSDRRREYFSGEYNYYPTPVREGIYKIATDANRLTTIFSEENPNACAVM